MEVVHKEDYYIVFKCDCGMQLSVNHEDADTICHKCNRRWRFVSDVVEVVNKCTGKMHV